MLRAIRNLIEDLRFPRARFTVEIAGRKVSGRVLTIGALRELTAAGAFDSADAMAEAARVAAMPRAEMADHMDRLITLAAVGLRRPPAWVARRCTSVEVAQVVAAILRASSPMVVPPKEKAAEGSGGPPA